MFGCELVPNPGYSLPLMWKPTANPSARSLASIISFWNPLGRDWSSLDAGRCSQTFFRRGLNTQTCSSDLPRGKIPLLLFFFLPVALANLQMSLTLAKLPEHIRGLTGPSQIAVASSMIAGKYLFLSDFCCSCFWVWWVLTMLHLTKLPTQYRFVSVVCHVQWKTHLFLFVCLILYANLCW